MARSLRARNWNESKHPRDDRGRFARKGGARWAAKVLKGFEARFGDTSMAQGADPRERGSIRRDVGPGSVLDLGSIRRRAAGNALQREHAASAARVQAEQKRQLAALDREAPLRPKGTFERGPSSASSSNAGVGAPTTKRAFAIKIGDRFLHNGAEVEAVGVPRAGRKAGQQVTVVKVKRIADGKTGPVTISDPSVRMAGPSERQDFVEVPLSRGRTPGSGEVLIRHEARDASGKLLASFEVRAPEGRTPGGPLDKPTVAKQAGGMTSTPEARRQAVIDLGTSFSGNPYLKLPKLEALTDDDFAALTPDQQDNVRFLIHKLAQRAPGEDQRRAVALQERFGKWGAAAEAPKVAGSVSLGRIATQAVPLPATQRTALAKIDASELKGEGLHPAYVPVPVRQKLFAAGLIEGRETSTVLGKRERLHLTPAGHEALKGAEGDKYAQRRADIAAKAEKAAAAQAAQREKAAAAQAKRDERLARDLETARAEGLDEQVVRLVGLDSARQQRDRKVAEAAAAEQAAIAFGVPEYTKGQGGYSGPNYRAALDTNAKLIKKLRKDHTDEEIKTIAPQYRAYADAMTALDKARADVASAQRRSEYINTIRTTTEDERYRPSLDASNADVRAAFAVEREAYQAATQAHAALERAAVGLYTNKGRAKKASVLGIPAPERTGPVDESSSLQGRVREGLPDTKGAGSAQIKAARQAILSRLRTEDQIANEEAIAKRHESRAGQIMRYEGGDSPYPGPERTAKREEAAAQRALAGQAKARVRELETQLRARREEERKALARLEASKPQVVAGSSYAEVVAAIDAASVGGRSYRNDEAAWRADIRARLNLPDPGEEPMLSGERIDVSSDDIRVGDFIGDGRSGNGFQVASVTRNNDGSILLAGLGMLGVGTRTLKADEPDVKVWRPGVSDQNRLPLRPEEDDLPLMARRMLQGFEDEQDRYEAAERLRSSKGLPSRPRPAGRTPGGSGADFLAGTKAALATETMDVGRGRTPGSTLPGTARREAATGKVQAAKAALDAATTRAEADAVLVDVKGAALRQLAEEMNVHIGGLKADDARARLVERAIGSRLNSEALRGGVRGAAYLGGAGGPDVGGRTTEAPAAPAFTSPQPEVYDKLLATEGPTAVTHKQARQIVEQMEAHGWKMTGGPTPYGVTTWKAPDGRELTAQNLFGQYSAKPRFSESGYNGRELTFKAALARVVTPEFNESGKPAASTAFKRLGFGDVNERDHTMRPLENVQRDLQKAAGGSYTYGGEISPEAVRKAQEDLRRAADNNRQIANQRAEYNRTFMSGDGEDEQSRLLRQRADQFAAVADELGRMQAQREASLLEVERRKTAPLDLRPGRFAGTAAAGGRTPAGGRLVAPVRTFQVEEAHQQLREIKAAAADGDTALDPRVMARNALDWLTLPELAEVHKRLLAGEPATPFNRSGLKAKSKAKAIDEIVELAVGRNADSQAIERAVSGRTPGGRPSGGRQVAASGLPAGHGLFEVDRDYPEEPKFELRDADGRTIMTVRGNVAYYVDRKAPGARIVSSRTERRGFSAQLSGKLAGELNVPFRGRSSGTTATRKEAIDQLLRMLERSGYAGKA